jgi:hypothetical protein
VPLQVVQHQDQGMPAGQGLQYPGHLLAQIGLRRDCQVGPGLLASHQFCQPGPPGGAARDKGLGADGQCLTRQETTDQVRPLADQGLHGVGEYSPQAAGVLGAEVPARPSDLHVTREHLHDLAERQVRIAMASVRVARPAGNHKFAMPRHGSPGELMDQHGLASARLAADKGDTALTGQCQGQERVQSRQLCLPPHKGGRGRRRVPS